MYACVMLGFLWKLNSGRDGSEQDEEGLEELGKRKCEV